MMATVIGSFCSMPPAPTLRDARVKGGARNLEKTKDSMTQ